MKNYWFRICFEGKFKNKKEAEEYLEQLTDDIHQSDLHHSWSYECEEREE